MNRQRISVRSRGSSSTNTSYHRGEQIKDWCRKIVAFMCTQVGVGGLIVGYALVGAIGFQQIEKNAVDENFAKVHELRKNCTDDLYDITEKYNIFDNSEWFNKTDVVLQSFQIKYAELIKNGFQNRTPEDIWTLPAALMYSLSVFSMIGYGNMYPKTHWGKIATVIYATFGIPLYILYFLNMGKVLAHTFRWLYTWFHNCTSDDEYSVDGNIRAKKKITVPSTACLWVITLYVLIGAFMFHMSENWDYLDSVYFCVTSLCKIGIGDFVPGTSFEGSTSNKQTKLAVNFVYMLLGMGLIAMCYNLMKEDVKIKMQEMKEDMRLCLDDIRVKFARCCGDKSYY